VAKPARCCCHPCWVAWVLLAAAQILLLLLLLLKARHLGVV
jgi:hypothetical protein